MLQLGSEVKLRFQVVQFVLRKEQLRCGFQPSFLPSLHGSNSPPVGGQADGGPVHWEGPSAPVPLPPQLLLMERKLQEVHPLLTLCGQIVENWQGNPIQKESLRVFFLVLQVTHYLDAGQVRSASHSRAAGEQVGDGRGRVWAEIPTLLLPHVPHYKVHLIQDLAPPHTLLCSGMSTVPLREEGALTVACPRGGSSLGLTQFHDNKLGILARCLTHSRY